MAHEINKAVRYQDKRHEGKEGQTHRGTETETHRKKWGINHPYQEWYTTWGSGKQQQKALEWLNGNWSESLGKFREEVVTTREAEFNKTVKTEHSNGVRTGKETRFLRKAFPKRWTDVWQVLPASPTVGGSKQYSQQASNSLCVWEDSKHKFTEGCFPHWKQHPQDTSAQMDSPMSFRSCLG